MRTTDVLEKLEWTSARQLYYWITVGAVAPELGRPERARQGTPIHWTDLDLARLEAIDNFVAAMEPITHRHTATDAIRRIWRALEHERRVDLGSEDGTIRLVIARRRAEGEPT